MAFTELRVSSFNGLQTLPIQVARQHGHFRAQELSVELIEATGSASQIAGLVRGEYHLIQTAPDNVITVNTTPASFGLDPPLAPRVVMVLGGSIGALGLYVRPGIADWSELRGATLGVDHPGSGFARVLRDLLQRHALQFGRDYHLTSAGGTDARWQALLRGDIAATMLYLPFDLLAEAGGSTRLASTRDHYAAYASLATAGAASWVDQHGDVIVRYITAILAALDWIYEPANAQVVQAMLLADPSLKLDTRLAERAYAAFVDPAVGFGRIAALDDAGLRQVLALRAANGTSPVLLGEPGDFSDLRWYSRAVAEHTSGHAGAP